MSDNLSHLAGRKGVDKSLFNDLVEAAKKNGTPEHEVKKKLAKEYLFGNANVHGTTSFYDFLKPENEGIEAYVCSGSACLLAGTQDDVKKTLEDKLGKEKVGHMCCLGRCHENSAFHYKGANYSAKSANDIASIIDDGKGNNTDQYHVSSNVNEPILTADPQSVEEFYQLFFDVLNRSREDVLEEIKIANIRGRGGAGFPMGFKLETCMKIESNEKYVVCNADEGDPGAYSDRYILEKQPHLLLFGMMVAGYVIGANYGILYIRGEYPESIKIMQEALADLRARKILGDNINGSDFSFDFRIVEGAGAYICGEETALLSSIEGQRPEVRVRPPYPAQEGLFNKPTVVNNVETSASVPFVMKYGGAAYKKYGTERSTGTKLVCLDSYFNRPGMYEVEMGTPLSEVINDLGQGFKSPVKALHIGGPLGGIVPVSKIDELTLDFESFANGGFLLGHASIICVPQDYPMIKYLEHLFEFTADESCGKCFPCSIGSVRGKEMISNAIDGKSGMDRKLMDDLLETLEIGSLCALGGGLPLGIKNALQYFDDELKEYFKN